MSQRARSVFPIAALAVLAGLTFGCKAPSPEQIQASLEVVDLRTQWVAKEYRQWPEPKLVLVPQVKFRVKNLTDKPLKYVNFNAIFKRKLDVENLGDNFLAAVRKNPVPPGGLSEEISLKSNFGVEGRNLDHFKVYPQQLDYVVKIYVQLKGSRHALLGEWKVSGTIDFKEDVPVHQEGKVIGKVPPAKVK
ncbi:MAG: hypothetical protein PHI34_02270 [Acidobacteriota bacterium]|nr:hypothetical protein [Acidobacteriota bacterium]